LRIAIVDPYYRTFLANHYEANPGLVHATYERQHGALLDRSFGTGDAYSRNLSELGHEAMFLGMAIEMTLPMVAWRMLTTISVDERVMWIVWIWALSLAWRGTSTWLRRRRLRRVV